jgi:hypothetical protein
MGIGMFKRGCYASPAASAPNPDPSRWELIQVAQFKHAHVLHVRYLDCTNFEGVKILVMRGPHIPGRRPLDPHFSEAATSLIARFRPDAGGMRMALELAEKIQT